MNVRSFWGKAQPSDPGRSPEWHPLAFHCLDVAAVGEALLMQHRGLGSQLPRLLGLPGDYALGLVCFLLSLHDIGKFAKKFQAKVPGRYPDCFDDDPERLAGIYDHGAGGLRLFDSKRDFFEPLGGNRYRTWRPLISAVTGHHGAPPAPRMNESHCYIAERFWRTGHCSGTCVHFSGVRTVFFASRVAVTRPRASASRILRPRRPCCAGRLDRIQSGLVSLS